MNKWVLSMACTLAPAAACAQNFGPVRDWGQPPSDTAVLIPTQFQGVWDAYPKACELAGSDMRSYIGPNRMRFGDSVGLVQRVIRRDSNSVTMVVGFRSDGDPSTDEVRLSLSPSGSELTIRIADWSGTRHRCPVKQMSGR